ncbi:MAG: hypothetical protein HDS78_03330 [Bacteroidales bacterium]|nr:hypothetical protein [Bacteroidales bacterium]
MDITKVVEALKSLDDRYSCEDYVTDVYRVSFPYERMDAYRRLLLLVSPDELKFIEENPEGYALADELYRLTMVDGYEGIAKLVCHFGLDISDKDMILDKLFDIVADLVDQDGNIEKLIILLKEMGINYTE